MFSIPKRKKLRSSDLIITWATFVFTFTFAQGIHFNDDLSTKNNCGIPRCEILPPPPPVEDENPLELFDLLARGSEFLNNYTDVTEAIVLLGNTGSGKSTLTQILTGNLSKLHSVLTSGCNAVIIDEDNRIGLPSTKSKTLFPELVFKADPNSNTTRLAFYDFPGFDDTRGKVLDIAANFFMNEVITKISTVKMLFLVTHSSVNFNERKDFDLFTTHAASFVKKLNKYTDSIALIVTKVANCGMGGHIEDHTIISGIVEFLNNYMGELRSKLSNSEENTVLLNKILFVETLLKQDPTSGDYSKIWFVRSPEDCGPLSEQEMIHHTKNNITKLYTHLNYTRINTTTDFGFTLTAENKIFMTNYTRSINSGISSAVDFFVEDLQRYFLKNGNLVDFENLNLTSFNRTMHTTSLLVKSIVDRLGTNISNSVELSNVLKSTSRGLGYHVPTQFHSFMGRQEEYLTFCDQALGETQERPIEKWSEPVYKLNQAFLDLADWYEFCLLLETHVSSYPFQSSKKYDLPSKSPPDLWLNYIETNQIISVTRQIKDISSRIDKRDLDLLDVIMTFALTQQKEYCDHANNAIVFQGNFMQLGKLPTASDFLTKCGNTTTQLHIYAAHTIFLDVEMNLENLDLVIIAPIWTNPFDTQLNISLVGKAALHNYPKAASGSTGYTGSSGCSGVAGNPGGSIFGISNFVQSSFPVSIISKGGTGGQGQEGGNGGPGSSRNNARGPEYSSYDREDTKTKYWNYCWFSSYNFYEHWGYSGLNGLPGGDGGISGISGIPVDSNNATLVSFQSHSLVRFTTKQTDNGLGGVGGRGGSGGRTGNGYKCIYHCFYWECSSQSANSGKGRVPGSTGRSGSNGASSLCPKDPQQPRELIKWPALVNYRTSFFNHTDLTTTTFFHHIDEHAESKHLFTLKALAEELLALESLNRGDVNPQRLREMYSSLIFRLENFSKTNYDTLSNEHKKVVNILLTLAYSSVMNFDRSQNYDVIVDVSYYFSIIQRQINLLQRSTSSQAIRQAKELFTQNLKGKINQALGFIQQTVTPAIDQAKENLEDKVSLLEGQLVSMIEDTKLSLEEMREQLRKANSQQRILEFLKIFSFVGKIFSALIPIPGLSMFDLLVQQLQEKYVDHQNELERLKQLVEEAEELMKELEEKREEFQDEFQPLVDSLLEYFKNVSESLNSGKEVERPQLLITKWQVMTKLKEVKNSLDVFSDASLNLQPLTSAIDRVQDAMTMAIDLYEMIEEYLETASLADYIAAVNSAQLGPINISDPEYVHTVANFDIKIRENLLDVEVKKAFHAFKQWVFPFAKFYFGGQPRFKATQNVSSELGAEHLHQVENLQMDLERYKSMSVGNQDTFIILTNFSSGLKTSKPFFTWKNDQWHDNIQSLLSGNKVNFQADVRLQGMRGWEAIKFKLIEINFKLNHAPDGMQEEFDDILEYFGVSMTHNGVSYYRFQQDYFVMTGANQTLKYNFERGDNGNRLGTNMVYQKFKNGDFLLSPYTLWTFQLRNEVPLKKGKVLRQDVGFDSLEKFLPYIDLELVGMGTYTDGEAAVAAANGDMQLDLYYERDDRIGVDFKF